MIEIVFSVFSRGNNSIVRTSASNREIFQNVYLFLRIFSSQGNDKSHVYFEHESKQFTKHHPKQSLQRKQGTTPYKHSEINSRAKSAFDRLIKASHFPSEPIQGIEEIIPFSTPWLVYEA